MPKINLRESFEMETRNKYTKVECELGLSVGGRELPSMSVLGAAVEEAVKLIEDRVKQSYEVVAPRGVDQTGIENHSLPGAIPEPTPVEAKVQEQAAQVFPMPVQEVREVEVKPQHNPFD